MTQTGKSLIVTHVLPKFFITLLISFLGTLISNLFIPVGIAFVIGLIPLVILITLLIKTFLGSESGKKGHMITSYGMKLPMWLVHTFSALMGIGLSPAIAYYADSMGITLVITAFAITSALFGGLFIYTYFTKRDFSFLGGMLFFSLLAIVLLGFANIFIGSSILELGLSFIGVLIFSGYMLYDIDRMKQNYFTEEDVPSAVLDLYLNFINIFLDMLRIFNFFK